MSTAERDDEAPKARVSDAARARADRRADALRANLKRRKAQTRARDEAGSGGPAPEGLGQGG